MNNPFTKQATPDAAAPPKPPQDPPKTNGSSSPAAVAVAEREVRQTKQARSVEVMAQTTYEAIRAYTESIGENPMEFWEDCTPEDKELFRNAVRWVISSRHLKPNPADLQDNFQISDSKEPYKHMAIEKRMKVFLFVAIVQAFVECEA